MPRNETPVDHNTEAGLVSTLRDALCVRQSPASVLFTMVFLPKPFCRLLRDAPSMRLDLLMSRALGELAESGAEPAPDWPQRAPDLSTS